MSTIGASFTFATAGTEDTLYGFSYANLKSAANESADTDGFLISSALNGDLYYNTGSTLAPTYTKISAANLSGNLVQVRITGIFVNNIKVSGSDPKLYWSPNNIDASGNVTSAGAGANLNGVTGIFTVRAVDNVDGIFGNGDDTLSGDTATASVNLTPVNDAPVITSNGGGATAAVGINENTTAVTTVIASDVDAGDTKTYSIVAGGDGAHFNINASSGALAFNSAPNFEAPTDTGADNTYTVTVRVTDSGALYDDQVITVTVANVNETPVNTIPGGTQTADAGRQVTFAGTVSVTDPDAGTTLITTLTVANGTLAASGAGVSGSGTGTVVVTGSVANVNAALATLVYTGDLGFSSDSLQVVSSDGALSDTDSITISAGFPQVMAVTAPANGYYSNEGTALMSFTVQFDQPVVVNTAGGTPSLGLTIGAASVNAAYTGGTGFNTLTFQYTVLDGQNDADGIDIGTLSLNGGTIKNGGGADANLSLAASLPDTTGVLVDTTNPTVAITDDEGGVANIAGGDVLYTFTFNEPVTGFAASDVTVANGTKGTFTPVSSTVYTLAVTPSANIEGNLTVDVAGGAAMDTAGNGNTAAAQSVQVVDTKAPTVAITDDEGGVANIAGGSVTYTFTFSQAVTGFDTSDVTVVNGAKGAFTAVDAMTYTLVVTPTPGFEGNMTVDVGTGAAVDANGNPSAAATQSVQAVDTLAPAAPVISGITSDNGSSSSDGITNDDTLIVSGTAEANADVDVFVDGASAGTTTADGSGDWSFDLEAAMGALSEATYALTAQATDVNGNVGALSGATSITIDTTNPTVVITDDEGGVANIAGGDVTYTFTFNEPVTGFAASDVTVANGTKGTFTAVSSTVYTLAVTPTPGFEGNMTVDVAGGAAMDTASNGNTAAVQSVQVVDTLAPTVAITDDEGGVANIADGDVTYTFEFSQDVIGFVASDVTVANGTKGLFTAVDGNTYTLVVTPDAGFEGNMTVDVAAGAAIDANSNDNTAATQSVQVVDTKAPTVAITDDEVGTANIAGGDVVYTFTFSEAVTGFDAGDVTVVNGIKGDFTAVSSTVYTLAVTPTSGFEGNMTVDVAGSAAIDANGNNSTAATQSVQAVDTLAPTVAITDDEAGVANIAGGDVVYTFTFSEAVTGFTADDVTVANGTKGTFTAVSSTVYTLAVTPQSGFAGNMTVDVNSGGAQDAAGNGNDAAAQSTQVVDTLRPTVVITMGDTALKIGDTATVTFQFSETVTGFDASDVTVDAGSLSGFVAVDGDTYTATFTPSVTTTDASNVITVGTGLADANGNAPAAATDSANYTVDTVRPTVAITFSDSVLNAYDTPTVTFTFSEAVQNFTAADVTVANGSIGAVSTLNNIVFTATLTPNASVEDATNIVTVGVAWADMADATGNAPAASTDSGNYTIDTLIPAPVYTGAVYDAATNTMIISGSNIGTLMSFLGMVESYGDDIAANLDFTKLHWDVDGNGSNDFTLDGHVDAAYVHDDHTLQIILSGAMAAAIEGAANYGSKAGSAWDNMVIQNGFSKDSSGNIAVADGATMVILGELNQAGMPMVFETDFSGATDLVNETLGLAGVASAAFDSSIDTLHIGVAAAATLTVAGDVVAGSSTSGSVVLMSGGSSVTLAGGSLTGSLDGSVITFDDGSVLKTNIGAKGTLSGGTGDDLLIAGANGDRLLGNAGDDLLIGGAGNDQIYGGTGADTIYGGGGNDYLVGGAGADNFVFTGWASGGNDTIADFVSGTDGITFDSGVVANIGALTIADSGSDLLVTVTSTGATIRLLGQADVNISGDLTFSAGSFYVDGQDVFA
ncbi:MAG: Ig-like domain-containing protein [Pseudomonadota bacterium]|nr:Ig-like domain-containing protein [Pseudomonadota bacterium]MDP1904227.1 Ig-like domain-containing protein [Pseudomonadota bacterium]